MKAIQIITHPVTLIISFLFILISGEHLGGFYMLYLLLALPYGGLHAVLGFVGIITLIVTLNKTLQIKAHKNTLLLRLLGVLFLVASLLAFFMQKGGGYNYGTFSQLMPIITLIFFIFFASCLIVYNVIQFINSKISALR